jgi:hypothetical protein
MPQQTDPQIQAKSDAAYTGGADRVEWVAELKIIIDDLIDSKINNDQKGVAGGVAELDGVGKLPITQSPIEDLTDLGDVIITAPALDEVLKFDGTNWVNDAASGGATTLDDLTDVVITGPASGDTLKHNGTNWINEAADPLSAYAYKGTYAQRIAHAAVDGDIWNQTDRLRGLWFYNGGSWEFQETISKMLFFDNFVNSNAGSTLPYHGYNAFQAIFVTGSGTTSIEPRIGSDYWFKLISTGGDIFYALHPSSGAVDQKYVDNLIVYYETKVEFNALGNVTNDYGFSVGFDNASSYSTGDRIIFRYNYNVNGGRWETRTVAAGSGTWTTKDTGVAVIAGTPIKLAYEVDGFAQKIYFYINDVLVTTHESPDNVPFTSATTLSGAMTPMGFNFDRLAGTASIHMWIDYVMAYILKKNL